MPQTVTIPGLGDVEFPDSMSDDDIAKAAQSLTAPATPEQPSRGEAFARGAGQGATLGFGDELGAAAGALGQKVLPESLGGIDYGKSFGDLYKENRDVFRRENAAAEKAHPGYYVAGNVAGSLPMTIASGGGGIGRQVATQVGQGLLQGAGYSDADTVGGMARDSALGGGAGLAGFLGGQAISRGAGAVSRFATRQANAATARAAAKAADEVAQQIASARGSLGGEVQKGSRYVENLMRLEPELPAGQQAAVSSLRTGETAPIPVLQQRVAQSTIDALPSQSAAIAAKDAELAALTQGAPKAIADRTEQLLSTKEAKQQILARALRYGPVALGSAVGAAVGGPLGSSIGALAGAGSRPMVQSLKRLAQNPAVQRAGFDALGNVADSVNSSGGQFLRQALARAAAQQAAEKLVQSPEPSP